MAFLIISMVGWLLGGPFVAQALIVLAEPKLSDTAIGAFVVAVATLVIGTPMFLVSVLLAVLAGRLSKAFRILSLLPGSAAILAGITMLVFGYR